MVAGMASSCLRRRRMLLSMSLGRHEGRWSRRMRDFGGSRRGGVVRASGDERSYEEVVRENEALKKALEQIDEGKLHRLLESLQPKVMETKAVSAPAKEASVKRALKAAADISWPSPKESPAFWERPFEEVCEGLSQSAPKDANPLHVVHITAEIAPIAKVGGLGDVVSGLARACVSRGHNVEVVLPFYESIDSTQLENLEYSFDFHSPLGESGSVRCEVFTAAMMGCSEVPLLLIRPENHFFNGGRIYGGGYNEMEAYLFFCRASLELLEKSGRNPDVLHLHDWHSSAVAMLYWEHFHGKMLNRAKVILTIHNMDNPGECRADEFLATGFEGDPFLDIDKALDERTIGHNPERMSLMKGGIVYSNRVSTVSPTYALETIQHGAAGFLGSTLATSQDKYVGILNGLDFDLWNPATDPRLPVNFDAESPQNKKYCKRYLQAGLGLKQDENATLVACITRLVPQKGIHLIRHAIHKVAERGGQAQFVLLGSAPDAGINGQFEELARNFGEEHPEIRLKIMYSEDLAHLIYAAADIVLVPSMFEPCGLTQMIAMRYGAIPCVRRTGGLGDTVFDVDDSSDEISNGFVFDGVDEGSLDSALNRALDYHRERTLWWESLVQKVLCIENSWNKSAAAYLDLYRAADL